MHGLEQLARQFAEAPPSLSDEAEDVLFPKMRHLEDYISCIADDGGKTKERYTIVFTDGDYCTFGPSVRGGQWHKQEDPRQLGKGCELVDAAIEGEVRLIRWIDLPEEAQEKLRRNINARWQPIYDLREEALYRDRSDVLAYDGNFSRYFPDYLPLYGYGMDARGRDTFRIKSSDPGEGDGKAYLWGDALRSILPCDYVRYYRKDEITIDTWNTDGAPCEPWKREFAYPEPLEQD